MVLIESFWLCFVECNLDNLGMMVDSILNGLLKCIVCTLIPAIKCFKNKQFLLACV